MIYEKLKYVLQEANQKWDETNEINRVLILAIPILLLLFINRPLLLALVIISAVQRIFYYNDYYKDKEFIKPKSNLPINTLEKN